MYVPTLIGKVRRTSLGIDDPQLKLGPQFPQYFVCSFCEKRIILSGIDKGNCFSKLDDHPDCCCSLIYHSTFLELVVKWPSFETGNIPAPWKKPGPDASDEAVEVWIRKKYEYRLSATLSDQVSASSGSIPTGGDIEQGTVLFLVDLLPEGGILEQWVRRYKESPDQGMLLIKNLSRSCYQSEQ